MSANGVLRNERRQEYLPPLVDAANGRVTLWQYAQTSLISSPASGTNVPHIVDDGLVQHL